MENNETKDFQDVASIELADELYELGQKAKKIYGEPVFGEFLIVQSSLYRMGIFQNEYRHVMSQVDTPDEEEIFDELIKRIPIDKDKIM